MILRKERLLKKIRRLTKKGVAINEEIYQNLCTKLGIPLAGADDDDDDDDDNDS